MSLYVLDTDILTLYRRGHATVCQRIASRPPADLSVAVISVEEQVAGWFALLRQARQPAQVAWAYQQFAEAIEFLSGWRIVSFTQTAIARYDQLNTMKLNVRENDLRIAAIALEHGGTVVTRNLRDFQRVPGLSVVNWAV